MNRPFLPILLFLASLPTSAFPDEAWKLDEKVRERCLEVLREGLRADDFWPAIHAAEGLTLAGKGDEVRAFLEPKLAPETDDQRRCGISRELRRAGDLEKSKVMMGILERGDTHGHVHAAESLYKVGWDKGGAIVAKRFHSTDDIRLKLMAAAALAKHGRDPDRAAAFTFLRENLRTHPDPATFRLSAWVLGRIGNDEDRTLIRSRIEDADDPLVRAFLHHSLARLGDPEGRKALLANLSSDDPAIRTYAAVFAGESGLFGSAPLLVKQLDDENLDAGLRAAQALIVLGQ